MIKTPGPLTIFAPLLLLALSACAAAPAPVAITAPTTPPTSTPLPGSSNVALGQRAYVDGPIVEAVKVLEDSRCPMNARCIHAGYLRVAMVWHRPTGEAKPFVAQLGERTPLADGSFMITGATGPGLAGEGHDEPIDYRFDFAFEGGI